MGNQQWFAYIESARNSYQDYAEYRRIRKDASRLLSAVSTVADQLASLLVELHNTHVRLPAELQSHSEHKYFSFGESQETNHLIVRRFVEDLRTDRLGTNRPVDLRKTLVTISKIAREYQVDFGCPDVEAAIATRQNSRKSSYLRAFGALLLESKIELSATITRAMAITANVILDDVDLTISEDTVRKALNRSKCLEKVL